MEPVAYHGAEVNVLEPNVRLKGQSEKDILHGGCGGRGEAGTGGAAGATADMRLHAHSNATQA